MRGKPLRVAALAALSLFLSGCGDYLADRGAIAVRDKAGKEVLRASGHQIKRHYGYVVDYTWKDKDGRSHHVTQGAGDTVTVCGDYRLDKSIEGSE